MIKSQNSKFSSMTKSQMTLTHSSKPYLPPETTMLSRRPAHSTNACFRRKPYIFFYSSSTLHWLSKIPKEITDKESSAWNKGKILYGTSSKEVVNAYANQHKEDMKNFLNARAQELVADGLMALQLYGTPDVILEPYINPAVAIEGLGSCLLDMAKEVIYEIKLPNIFLE